MKSLFELKDIEPQLDLKTVEVIKHLMFMAKELGNMEQMTSPHLTRDINVFPSGKLMFAEMRYQIWYYTPQMKDPEKQWELSDKEFTRKDEALAEAKRIAKMFHDNPLRELGTDKIVRVEIHLRTPTGERELIEWKAKK